MFDTYNYSVSHSLSSFVSRVYSWMTGGLMITAITAYFASQNVWLMSTLFHNSLLLWALFAVQLGIVWGFSSYVSRLSLPAAAAIFVTYAILMGITLSYIFLIYHLPTIAMVFGITACMFGSLALYGYYTERDLSGWGSAFLMALVGILIASVVNIFLASSAISFFLSYISVFIFAGLVAYDTQMIKGLGLQVINHGDNALFNRVALIGALYLYLDFINLFMNLLRIFGRRKD